MSLLIPSEAYCSSKKKKYNDISVRFIFCLTDINPLCLLTAVCLSWLSPLLHLGHKRKLEESDMYSVLPEDQSEILGEELHRYYITVIHTSLFSHRNQNA